MDTGQSEPSVTVNDGGILPTRACCHGRGNTPQATALRHRSLRRKPMAVALSLRVSPSRPPQPQTMAPHRSRLHASVARQPAWPVADAPF